MNNQQVIATKKNVAKSTGPKTEGGKARASDNSLKHGLKSSTKLLLHDEEPQALAKLRDALGDELNRTGDSGDSVS